ncbi:MAG: hypothetical protein PHR77_05615 [Kiritimatiellae bacterium]|nr:hypothetical protein [Kiritimatiellia bacterium]MDD5519187.1 hypothetical protein [Kiritimatiellia bacterium]
MNMIDNTISMRVTIFAAMFLAMTLFIQQPVVLAGEETVTVRDSGAKTSISGWREGHKDHKWQEQTIALDSGKKCYTLKYRACIDPSHPGVRASEEGYIGMPTPSSANWYHSGFFFITINGKDIGETPLIDMRVTETGTRGACHMVWDTPDATVRVQFLVASGSDHLLSDVSWTAKPDKKIESVNVRFNCYPSYFTSHNRRQGDRTVITPRIEKHETTAFDLVPNEDLYLLYLDGVFDVAKGEGDGPCAMLFLPEEIASGKINISNYPVGTSLKAVPTAKRLRFAFWDLTGTTNAVAKVYFKENASKLQQELRRVEFLPESILHFNPTAAKAETDKFIADAKEDGVPLKAKATELLKKMTELKTKAEANDWSAAAEFAKAQPEFEALMWKLKIFALLNTP